MKIVFTGGGTGGHIFPIIAIIREIRKIVPLAKIYYLGPRDPFAKKYLLPEGVIIFSILSGKLRRYFDPKSFFLNIFDLLIKIPLGFIQSFVYLLILNPDLVFSKGGYGSLPVAAAARLLFLPVFLHESDSMPGLANRILAKLANEVFVSFPDTPHFSKNRLILIGNPIRTSLFLGEKEEAMRYFNLDPQRPTILILGGSQGAQRLNEKILTFLPHLLKNYQILHQCGEKEFERVVTEAKVMVKPELFNFYHPFPFFEEEQLIKAYAVADLVVSRAGGGAIFEILALGKPAILVPLPESAQEHQVKNAYFLAKHHAALVIEEENLTTNFFLQKLEELFSSPERLKKLSENAKAISKPRAAFVLAKYIVEYLRQ
jgi:UDP-N-acetylglucosamine--N-acetylmuramyl-(pentapeptide) pyrophosphoryl-undecaprenol N-acetylglucosamine transferase